MYIANDLLNDVFLFAVYCYSAEIGVGLLKKGDFLSFYHFFPKFHTKAAPPVSIQHQKYGLYDNYTTLEKYHEKDRFERKKMNFSYLYSCTTGVYMSAY